MRHLNEYQHHLRFSCFSVFNGWRKQPEELSPADDVAGMAAQRMEFHKAPFTVFRIHPESDPDQHRCGNDPETDADPT